MKTLLKISLLIFLLTQMHYPQWVQVGPPGLTIYSLATSGSNVFAGTYLDGLYRSTDDGQTWTQTSLNNGTIHSLAISGSTVLAGGNGVYISSDNGQTWAQSSLNITSVNSLTVNGTDIFAGTDSGIYYSSDSGLTWVQTTLYNQIVYSIAISGLYIFAGTISGILRSSDYGQTWSQPSLYNIGVQSIATNGLNVIAGTWEEGLFYSSDNGETWSYTPALYTVPTLLYNNQYVFAGSNGVYHSTNHGRTWTDIGQGLPGYVVLTLAVSEEYLYAGMVLDVSIWRRPLYEVVPVEIEYLNPEQFWLSQNFPNPFNPTTTIKYSTPTPEFVTLKIYDILGNEVATLVNEEKPAGSYEIDFNAAGLSSGIYFYKLQAGRLIETKKMILLR